MVGDLLLLTVVLKEWRRPVYRTALRRGGHYWFAQSRGKT